MFWSVLVQPMTCDIGNSDKEQGESEKQKVKVESKK